MEVRDNQRFPRELLTNIARETGRAMVDTMLFGQSAIHINAQGEPRVLNREDLIRAAELLERNVNERIPQFTIPIQREQNIYGRPMWDTIIDEVSLIPNETMSSSKKEKPWLD